MKLSLWLIALAALLGGYTVRLTEAPAQLQLYPRNHAGLATVRIQGVVVGSGADSVVCTMYRNGVLKKRTKQTLAYQGDSALFTWEGTIRAELAMYRFVCEVDTGRVLNKDSIVAGDVFLIEGQSNARLGKSALNQYVRTMRLSDSAWTLTDDCAWAPLPQKIIEKSKVPICVINEAVPGSVIASHQKGKEPYNNQLRRAQLAKAQNQVKAIFWYQGEWDAGYGAETGYIPQFDQLYQSWKLDYPGVQKIYLVQINTWQTAGSRELREADRRIAHLYPNIEIMPAIGGLGYDGHGGYTELGTNLYGIVARDLFNSRDTALVRAPEIQRAYYTTAAKTHIALEFSQPVFWNAKKDSVVYLNERNVLTPGLLKDYFAMNDSTWESVDTCWFENGNRRLVLQPKAGMSARTISYMPDWYNLRGCNAMSGPVLWNLRKVPAVTFAQFPVEAPAVYDTGSVAALTLTASKQTVALFERLPLRAVVDYVGGGRDTNHYVTFKTADTFVVTLSEQGMVRGVNPGTAQIIASKGTLSDTLTMTVGSGMVAMDSIAFSPRRKEVMLGDSAPLYLVGYASDAYGSATLSLDTMANCVYDGTTLYVGKGQLRAIKQADSTTVVALFGSHLCTLTVVVPAIPTFVRRINFQPRGDSIKTLPGWIIDSGLVYSAAKGQGSVAAWNGGQHSPHIANYLRATWAQPGAYQIDCPDGNYQIRMCQSQWLWAQPGLVRLAEDTLAKNPLSHASDGIATDGQVWISDRRITVTGGAGLRLNTYGGVAYLVVASDDGAELNVVAKDGWETVPPKAFTEIEYVADKGTLLREPVVAPNPFNPTTTVRFQLPARVSAQYGLYDIRGRRVMTEKVLASSSRQSCKLTLHFQAMRGGAMASGTYLGRLEASDGKVYTHTLVLVR